jgi:putative tryptophan/tyrosine transport system substrate-binding protein
MRRRDFIPLIGSMAAWPLAALAQQSQLPLIGFLGSDTPDQYSDRLLAFREGLKKAGYVESRNVAIEYRWARGSNDALPALAADLVGMRPAVLVASTTPSIFALKAATKTIPIVFFTAADPVALGLVTSLNRPGGNLTGTTALTLEVGTKWLQLLKETVPTATAFAVLVNPTSPTLAEAQTRDLRAAASTLGVQIHVLDASTDREFESVFAGAARLGAAGLVISSDSFFFAHIEKLAALASRHKLPAIFGFREYPKAGGLMSYGADLNDQHRTVGAYVGRILNGEKPGDLPVQQSVHVQLVVNLKAAKLLGLTMPSSLLLRADEIIE